MVTVGKIGLPDKPAKDDKEKKSSKGEGL